MIELDKVSYGFGNTPLFSRLSLRLTAGSFHFLTGPSGAGKTTLLRLCYADLRAKSGALRLFGQDAAGVDRDAVSLARRRIGVVHQDCQFLDHLPVSENIALPLTVTAKGGLLQDANLQELIGWVGLSARAHALPPELSGGERQRAALARAVIMDPDIILADEPTGNVDWDMSLRLLQLLQRGRCQASLAILANTDNVEPRRRH